VARKGRIREESELAYRAAAADGVQVIILRGGDFLDPSRDTTIMKLVMLKSLAGGRITAMGDPEVTRAYAFLPDMARAAVALAERRDTLPRFADVPFPGHAFSMREVAGVIGRLTGKPPKITRFGWWQLTLLAPFWELARELREMRYLYDIPHSLDGTLFLSLLPGFEVTPLDAVIAAHLPEAAR
jgi:nucleoside-diphosphate-sugar epimerase